MELDIAITPKIHSIIVAVPEFYKNINGALRFYVDPVVEPTQHVFNIVWSKYRMKRSRLDYGKK